jgi:putative transposase
MKVVRGYRTELDLNDEQRTACLKHAGAARFAYNWGLARSIEAYRETSKRPTAIKLHRDLNKLKQTDYPWMYDVSKCAPQEALRDLDKAYKHFYRRVALKKQGKWKGKLGFPKMKKRSKAIGSFRLTGSIKVFSDAVQLPRLGRLRLHEHDFIPTNAQVLSATVSEEAGRWFVSIQVEEEAERPVSCATSAIGVDLGIKQLATLSDGKTFANPRALKRAQKRLRRASAAEITPQARRQESQENLSKVSKAARPCRTHPT